MWQWQWQDRLFERNNQRVGNRQYALLEGSKHTTRELAPMRFGFWAPLVRGVVLRRRLVLPGPAAKPLRARCAVSTYLPA